MLFLKITSSHQLVISLVVLTVGSVPFSFNWPPSHATSLQANISGCNCCWWGKYHLTSKTKKPFQSDRIFKTACGETSFYFVILQIAKTIICPMKEKDFDFRLSMVQNFCSLTLSIFISNFSRRVNISIYSKTFTIKEFLENFTLQIIYLKT